jgi:Flp pilus assembly protein TadG
VRFTRGQPEPDAGPSNGRGQALVEFALVAPILVLLMLAIFQFAYVMESQMGLTNAVREAARRAAAAENPTPAFTLFQLTGTGSPPDRGLLAENVQGYNALEPGQSMDATFCSYTVDTVTNYRVDVEVTYPQPVFFPLLSFATDLTDGNPGNGKWDLRASAQMRIEHALTDPGVLAGVNPC